MPPIKTGKFWISNPCGGDIKFAVNTPNELVFSTPMRSVERLLKGMEQRASYIGAMPITYQMEPEGWLPDSYFEAAKIMKMHGGTE